jgi:uncharacterized protein YgbK (DUF1537 family)
MSAKQQPMRLVFYGDDFTGSTDALEVLTFSGLRCALFLEPPSIESLAKLGPFDAIGIAGNSRAMTPHEMLTELPPILEALAGMPVPIVHYKVCSTFDSGMGIGSMGKVMDLCRASFGDGPIPVVAATPALGRYCVFGHLFARSGADGQVYRLDRHPIMMNHPVTPMTESDLKVHIGQQTRQRLAGIAWPQLELSRADQDLAVDEAINAGADALLFDGTTAQHLTEVGRQLERLAHKRTRPLFAVGSSGLEYALTQWWGEQAGQHASQATSQHAALAAHRWTHLEPVAQVLAISASASTLSALQIDVAIEAGFVEVAINAKDLVTGQDTAGAYQAIQQETLRHLNAGRSVILHTARGSQDHRISELVQAFQVRGMTDEQARLNAGRLLGQCLGRLTEALLKAISIPRLLLSGGDTSSAIMQQLGPQALEVVARIAPGAPLCKLLSDQAHLRSLQVALKGGQMGARDFFVTAKQGHA